VADRINPKNDFSNFPSHGLVTACYARNITLLRPVTAVTKKLKTIENKRFLTVTQKSILVTAEIFLACAPARAHAHARVIHTARAVIVYYISNKLFIAPQRGRNKKSIQWVFGHGKRGVGFASASLSLRPHRFRGNSEIRKSRGKLNRGGRGSLPLRPRSPPRVALMK
jgi:hypothetical protein